MKTTRSLVSCVSSPRRWIHLPEAVPRHGPERDDHGDGRHNRRPRLGEGGNAPGNGQDTGPDDVLDEVEDGPADGHAAGAGAGLHRPPFLTVT